MPLHQATLNRQLQQADERLSAYIKQLDEQGVSADQRSRNAKCRQLKAACSQIRSRIKVFGDVIARDEEVAKRKAEKLAGPKEESKGKSGKGKSSKAKSSKPKAEKGAKEKPKKEKPKKDKKAK